MPEGAIDRAGVSQLLGIGKTEAWKLLRRWGAPAAGGAIVAQHSWLLNVLRQVQSDPGYRGEVARRLRIASQIEALRQDLKARQIPIASPPRTVRAIGGLPDTIRVGAGCIEIQCENAADALQQLLQLARAISEDYATFEEVVGAARQAAAPQ
jgi:hypothetical protein